MSRQIWFPAGVAIAIVGEEADPVLKFFTSVTVIVMKITQWIIMLAPVGVMFLVAGQILEMGDLVTFMGFRTLKFLFQD